MSENSKKVQSNIYAWVILGIAYLATVSTGIMMNKVAPAIPTLVEVFGINLSQVGLLVSVYAFTSVLLAIPAGLLISRYGQKTIGILAFLTLIFGSILGANSNTFNMMLISRMLEGLGSAFIVVLAPAAIARRFSVEKVGMPMGIWSTATPVGGFIALAYIPDLIDNFGWKTVWWGASAFTLIALVSFVILYKPLHGDKIKQDTNADMMANLRAILKNKNIWIGGIVMMSFAFVIMPIVTYYPTFLTLYKGFDLGAAGFMVGLISLAILPSSPLIGWFSDLIGSRKKVVIAGFLILLPLFPILFHVSGWLIPLFMILIGIGVAAVPTPMFAAATDLVGDVKLSGLAMAVLTMGLNLGIVFGAPIFGALVDSKGWNMAAYIFTPFAILGIVMAVYSKKLK